MTKTKKRQGGTASRLTEIRELRTIVAKLREDNGRLMRLVHETTRAAEVRIRELEAENAALKRQVEVGIQSVRIERPGEHRG